MSGMSYGDYGKRDNTGKGVSRVAVLLDAIRNVWNKKILA